MWKLAINTFILYHQRPDNLFYQVGGESGIIDTLSFQNYGQLRINVERFRPLSNKLTLITQINSGMNLKQNQSFLNFLT